MTTEEVENPAERGRVFGHHAMQRPRHHPDLDVAHTLFPRVATVLQQREPDLLKNRGDLSNGGREKTKQNIVLVTLVVLLLGVTGIFASAWCIESMTPYPGNFSFAFAAGLTTISVCLTRGPLLVTVETGINEAFWQGLHGGARSKEADVVSANYVLFSDGTGTLLPEGGRVPTLPTDGVLSDESDLRFVRVADIGDGDLIVLRSGESGLLLDEASKRIMSKSGDPSLVDRATDWKELGSALAQLDFNQPVVPCSGSPIALALWGKCAWFGGFWRV